LWQSRTVPKSRRESNAQGAGRLNLAGFPLFFAFLQLDIKAMEQRKAQRVVFERGHAAHMMAIDGTWRRACTMEDVSDTGAKLTIDGSIEGLHLTEFFLLLSSTGLAYRRCQLAWVNGDQVGVNFLKRGEKKKKPQT
jgi:hypothetical protein